jgi:hypothetical protein
MFVAQQVVAGAPVAKAGSGIGWPVDDIAVAGGYLFLCIGGSGVYRTAATLAQMDQDRSSPTGVCNLSAVPLGPGVVQSSVYEAGKPGVKKVWSSISVDCVIPTGGAISVELSYDGGRTWGEAWAVPGGVVRSVCALNLGGEVSTRMSWRVTLTAADGSATPIVYNVNVGYVLQSSCRWQWEFTVIVAEDLVQLDGGVDGRDATAARHALEASYRAGVPVDFVDIDPAVTYTKSCLITDFAQNVVVTSDPIESEARLVLLELTGS